MGDDFGVLVRLRTRAELRRLGYSRSRINDMMDACDDGCIAAAKRQTNASIPTEEDPLPPGPKKTLWERIKEWINSPEGKAFISALIQILLTVIVAI